MPRKRTQSIAEKRIDVNLRAARLERGLSQTQLAEKIDITFQQLQKYETGVNRVSASTLAQLAFVLGCSIDWLLKGVFEQGVNAGSSADTRVWAIIATSEGMDLLKAFARIGNRKVRRRVMELAVAVADAWQVDIDPDVDDSTNGAV
jgi:transcriptional regulator with XRE-family HTH domain